MSTHVITSRVPYQAFSRKDCKSEKQIQYEWYKKLIAMFYNIDEVSQEQSIARRIMHALLHYRFVKGWAQISRTVIARRAKCHVDTVSKYNMLFEQEGILLISRAFKECNVYQTKAKHALLAMFGFVRDIFCGGAFQLDPDLFTYSTLDTKESSEGQFFLNQQSKKEEFLANQSFSSKSEPILTPGLRPYVPKPLNDTIEVSPYDQLSINVSALFHVPNSRIKAERYNKRFEEGVANQTKFCRESKPKLQPVPSPEWLKKMKKTMEYSF